MKATRRRRVGFRAEDVLLFSAITVTMLAAATAMGTDLDAWYSRFGVQEPFRGIQGIPCHAPTPCAPPASEPER